MKHVKYIFILFALFSMLYSCGEGSTENPEIQYAKLQAVSVKDNDVFFPEELSEITLTFFRSATIANPDGFTLNNQKVNAIISPTDNKQVVINLPQLQFQTLYVLEVKEGAITVNYSGENRPNESITIHFSVKQNETPILDPLSNPNAIPAAKNLYDFLTQNYGKKIISSAIANVNWNFAEAELVYNATGKYPAIATMDYIHMFTLTSHSPYHGQWVVHYEQTQEVENWWSQNGLIAAGWHWVMPANEDAIDNPNGYTCTPGNGNVGDNTTTSAKPANIMKEGTWEKRIADEDLQKMAELLLALQDKGIPVIWRPLHEASGNTYGPYAGAGAWFWWGAQGAQTYIMLWQYMYNFFLAAGVNNLIWVWTSQNNGDTDWYPGDEYVDIIGQDIYNQGANANADDFRKLQASFPNKMITLSECGNVGKISDQWKAGAQWSYFMPWYQYNATTLDNHQYANTEWWVDAMKQTFVISRDDMPNLK